MTGEVLNSLTQNMCLSFLLHVLYLNPIRANIADTLEDSDFTSILSSVTNTNSVQ